MRMLKLTVALIAVLGWAAAAHAGTTKKVYNVSTAYGASGKIVAGGYNFTAMTVSGSLKAAVSTPNSTFTSHWSNPPPTAWVHMQPTGMVTAMGRVAYGFPLNWTVSGTVKLHVQGSTQCHVASHTALSDTVIPASCHLAGLSVYTKAHCAGHGVFSGVRCQGGFGTPGCWTGASDTHTQMWKAKSIHCDAIRFSHSSLSGHYMKSCNVKTSPPNGHTCGSGSGPHLASSDSGYHTFHIAGKLKSTP